MRTGIVLAALMGVGALIVNREVRMSIGETLAKAVTDRNSEKLIKELAMESWHESVKEGQQLKAELEKGELAIRCLRDIIMRQDAKLKASELSLAEYRRQIEVMQKRLDAPLVMPPPQAVGIGMNGVDDEHPF